MEFDFGRTVSFTFDVEWACDEVIADTCALLDSYKVRGTFFVTHDGVRVPGHERALHPNFRRNGDLYRTLTAQQRAADAEVYANIVKAALTFAPEAKGVRAHSLLFDSALLPIYRAQGIEYDSSYRLELCPGLTPFMKQHGIVEIPAYYADYYDLVAARTGFHVEGMLMEQPGLKVLDFHPNLIFTNARTEGGYNATKSFYHDPARLLSARESGSGTGTLLVELLEYVARERVPTATLGEINAAWRGSS